MRQILRVIAALIAGFFGGFILYVPLHIRLLPPSLFVPACMIATWFLLPRFLPMFRSRPADAGPTQIQLNGRTFEATHGTKNLAINASTRELWFRDKKGKQWILGADDIRTWNHEWTDRSNNYGMIAHNDNYLVLTTDDIDHPTHKIWMGGHFKHEHAKEWHARLTAMLKS
jgi:hypothetical protein